MSPLSPFEIIVHVLVAALLPPLLLGVIVKTKAYFAGRVGAPLLQPYYELYKLFYKGSVVSHTTTWLFQFGPVVSLVTAALATLLIPLGYSHAPISFSGDFLFLAYLLALARFCLVLAALDTGSAFEGMGAAREVTYACLAEPSVFLGLLVLAKVTKTLSLSDMLGGSLLQEWQIAGAPLLLVLASWFVVMLVENCRIPFDDPNTHLELTMIHEVIVLDHSGPGFGMILYGAALKLFVFGALVVRMAVPMMPNAEGLWWISCIDWVIFLLAMLGVAVVIGMVESGMARLRLPLIPNVLVMASVLAAFGFVLMISQ